MGIILGIVSGLVVIICSVLLINKGIKEEDIRYILIGYACCLLSAFIAVFVYISIDGIKKTNDTPQAIDVYRGKTTLKITYEDSIPVDTVVIFKNKQ